jgi:hypothetical protein
VARVGAAGFERLAMIIHLSCGCDVRSILRPATPAVMCRLIDVFYRHDRKKRLFSIMKVA